MYPITLGYEGAKNRINSLMQHGHHAEALVTSVFTTEKMLRRTLRQIIVSAGFTSKVAEKLIGKINGLEAIKIYWEFYEPSGKTLIKVIGEREWSQIKQSAEMRNKLVHGVRVYEQSHCQEKTEKLLSTLDIVKQKLDETYGYSGWERFTIRKRNKLHIDPKVKIQENK